MATCKECLHERACVGLLEAMGYRVYTDYKENGTRCATYTPKSQYAEVKHGENITKQHPVDEFICSECGLIMRDLTEVRIDEDNEDECYYEFEFNYCPNCGAKMDGGKQ